MLPMMNDELTEVNRLFLILHILVYFGFLKAHEISGQNMRNLVALGPLQ